MKWSLITVIKTSLVQRYYAPTFPVYQDYLTSKHSQLTYCRSNASQPGRATPVLELTLVEYTFGHKTTNQLSEKEKFNLGGYWAPCSCQWPLSAMFYPLAQSSTYVTASSCGWLGGDCREFLERDVLRETRTRRLWRTRHPLWRVRHRLYWSILRNSFVVTDQLHR